MALNKLATHDTEFRSARLDIRAEGAYSGEFSGSVTIGAHKDGLPLTEKLIADNFMVRDAITRDRCRCVGGVAFDNVKQPENSESLDDCLQHTSPAIVEGEHYQFVPIKDKRNTVLIFTDLKPEQITGGTDEIVTWITQKLPDAVAWCVTGVETQKNMADFSHRLSQMKLDAPLTRFSECTERPEGSFFG